MAEGFQQIEYWRPRPPLSGWLVALGSLGIGILPFAFSFFTLVQQSESPFTEILTASPQLWSSLAFTIKQASISAVLVGVFAPIFGIGLFFLPNAVHKISVIIRTLVFCLPSIVIATGIILAWGNNGLATRFSNSLGVPLGMSDLVYSPYAVVIANVMMNLPFAALMIFRGIGTIPLEQINASMQMGLGPLQNWTKIIWPAIRTIIVYFTGMTFILCMGSFGALSILSSSPASQTLEMGIYQAIYFDADWNSAATFALMHTACAGIAAIAFLLPQYAWATTHIIPTSSSAIEIQYVRKLFTKSATLRTALTGLSLALDLFILIPIFAIFIDAFTGILSRNTESTMQPALLSGLKTSLGYAIPTAFAATFSAWGVARSFCHYRRFNKKKTSVLLLLSTLSMTIVPSMSAAFGFLVIRSFFPDFITGKFTIICSHSIMVLPLLVNIFLPKYSAMVMPFNSLREIQGINNLKWIKDVEWRIIGQTIAIMIAVSIALSLNETAIVSLLGDPISPALTTTMIRLMGHYRFGDSAVASCFLIIVTSCAVALSNTIRSNRNGSN